MPTFEFIGSSWRKIAGAILTFNLVCFSWIFFRSESMESAKQMLNQIFNRFGGVSIVEIVKSYHLIFLLILIGFAIHWLPFGFKEWFRGKFIDANILVKGLVILIVVVLIIQFRTADIQPFIYFRF